MRIVIVCIVVALSLAIHIIECNNNVNTLHFSNSDLPTDNYELFLKNFIKLLSSGFYSNGRPVLRPSTPNTARFFIFVLTGPQEEKIIGAVDVLDASLTAYCAGNQSYFFSNAPQIAYRILCNDTTRNTMDFDNSFQSLEKAAGVTRSEIPLGEAPFDAATSSLYRHDEFVPESLLVIIQMIIEAAKFRLIRQHVVDSLRHRNEFLPSLAIVSLEDNWSELSFQIQASASLQGLFGKPVLLYNSNDEPIEVDSLHYPIVHANLIFELYTCLGSTKQEDINNMVIKMPGSVKDDTQVQNNKCKLGPQTVRISGRDGLCVDVGSAFEADGSRVILYPCGQQVNQKWTFYPDLTIRSLGRCLAPSRSANNIVIYDCENASEEIYWEVLSYGRITTFFNDMVLTAKEARESANLTVETNTFGAEQTWRVGNYVKPFIVSIVGLKNMCLEATNGNNDIWLEDCVKNKEEQSWALYSDGTIRVNQNHSLCVASSTDASSKAVAISSCNGSNNERWVFGTDGTILNGRSQTVMDVAQNNVNLKKIIVHPANGEDNQQWVILY